MARTPSELLQGTVDILILRALAWEPMHGYAISHWLDARSDGVLSVDGKELSRKTMEHSIPFLMAIDETFDIGCDTRTPVDDSYELPFHFNGKIDKLTYKLGPEQLMEEDNKAIAAAEASVKS